MISVLYLDKDRILLESGRRFLERDEDIHADTVESFSEALQLLKSRSFDAFIADNHLQEIDRIQLIHVIRENFPKIPLIIFTTSEKNEEYIQAVQNGADYFIRKNGELKSRFAELCHILRLAVKLRETEQKITRLNRVYSVQSRIREAIVHFPDRMQLIQEVCRIAVQEGGYPMAWIGLEDHDTHRIKGIVASGAVDDFFIYARMSSEDTSFGVGPTVIAMRKGKYVICNDIRSEAPLQYWADYAVKKGYLSAAAFPLSSGNILRGVITFYSTEKDFFTDSEIRLLNGLSEDVSFALDRMELDDTRRQIRERLSHVERLMTVIADSFPEPTFAIDAKGIVTIWNTAMEKLTGIGPVQVIGRGNYEHSFLIAGERIPSLLDLVFASDKELETYHYSVLYRSDKSIRAIIRLPELNGKPTTLEVTATPLYDQKGQYTGAVESLCTITGIHKRDEEFAMLFDTADRGIFILESDTKKIIDANLFLAELTGYPLEQLFGRTLEETGLLKDKLIAEQFFAEPEKDGRVYKEFPLETKNGRVIDVELVSERYSLKDKQVIRCSVHDISGRKQRETAQILARNNLNMFLSMTRHNILNQLMVVSGSLELASYGSQEPELLQHLNRAQTGAKNIQHQIIFSREYENLGVSSPVWQHVSHVINQAFSEVQRGTVVLDLPGDTLDVFADPLLEKVFFHLFSYALKYGENVTRIDVSYQYKTTGLVLSVADNGAGISPENKAFLFVPGSGNEKALGLFLAQKILEITGLTIRESGEYKKGARFEIIIPTDRFRTESSDQE